MPVAVPTPGRPSTVSPADAALAEHDLWFDPVREKNIDPAAKADQPDALTAHYHVARLYEPDDPPRDQARRSG